MTIFSDYLARRRARRQAALAPPAPASGQTAPDPRERLGPARHALRRADPTAGLRSAYAMEPETELEATGRALRTLPLHFAPAGEMAVAMEDLHLPSRTYPDDAGLDLFVTQDAVVRPGEFVDIHCHLAVELPPGVWALVIGRSSTLRKRGLMVNPGIIDTGYRGELFTGVWNMGPAMARVEFGERLAQLILFDNVTARYFPHPVDQLSPSLRGSQGFGSSGR